MTAFTFPQLVQESPDIVSAALGVDAANPLTANDIGKGVKLAANNNYVLCADGDEIEAILDSINPDTVNDGFAFGSVRKNGRSTAVVTAAALGALPVGALVTVGVQAALGVAGGLVVDDDTAPTVHIWRVISWMAGAGAVGDVVMIEKI